MDTVEGPLRRRGAVSHGWLVLLPCVRSGRLRRPHRWVLPCLSPSHTRGRCAMTWHLGSVKSLPPSPAVSCFISSRAPRSTQQAVVLKRRTHYVRPAPQAARSSLPVKLHPCRRSSPVNSPSTARHRPSPATCPSAHGVPHLPIAPARADAVVPWPCSASPASLRSPLRLLQRPCSAKLSWPRFTLLQLASTPWIELTHVVGVAQLAHHT